ncbi:MAG: hypothetical protein ABSG25_00785 [Bryobacteraceae bacterium]
MRKAGIPCLLALAAALGCAEIIDRIAVTVDNRVIAESEVAAAIRTAAFLNGETPDLSGASKRQAAGRIADQILFVREMELTHYPQPAPEEADALLKNAKARFKSEDEYKRALAACRIDEAALRDALQRQLSVLRFIDLRFRSEVQVQEADVQQYYESVFLPEARRRNVSPQPSFDEARAQCEQALTEQAIDLRLERWLNAVRSHARIEYREEAFQ